MAENTSNCRPEDISNENLNKNLEDQVASLDPLRVEAFSGLQRMRAARQKAYVREQKRLALKYGSDSARITALNDKMTFNQGLQRDIAFEQARAQSDAPVVDENGYVFHGFVWDRKGQGVSKLTVALYDEQGDWIRVLGYGCTDERGYFILNYQSPQKDVSGVENSVAAMFKMAASAVTRVPSVYIHILNADQKSLQIEKEPLYPKLGEIDFRIIILGKELQSCTPPTSAATSVDSGVQPPSASSSTPLENIKGIGPKTADKLRAAGIPDVETFLKTPGEKLVEIAGFDADVMRREAEKVLKERG